MNSFQKVIKYCAVALAIFIIFSIVTGIIYGVGVLKNVFVDDGIKKDMMEKFDISSSYNVLDIEVNNANVLIKEDKKFKVEVDSEDIKVKEVGNKILITEKKYGLFEKKEASDLIISVPKDFMFEEVVIESGAGRVDIDGLSAKEIELDLGAGKVNLNKINVSGEISIDGGAGEIIIDNSILNNLDLDMGIGKVNLVANLIGNSDIDAGVGEVEMLLLGEYNDYKININKGIGSVVVDGDKMSDGSYYGSGSNIINIDGGIGNININFK